MTQKEYIENLKEKENRIKALECELAKEKTKNVNYEMALENNAILNHELKEERQANVNNIFTIKQLEKTIERYEKILDRVSINCE